LATFTYAPSCTRPASQSKAMDTAFPHIAIGRYHSDLVGTTSAYRRVNTMAFWLGEATAISVAGNLWLPVCSAWAKG